MPVKDTDKGLKALLGRLKNGKRLSLTVGIHGPEGSEPEQGTGVTILEVATINEFGIGVPERSFIRGWYDENEVKNYDILRKIGYAVHKGIYDARTGLERVGLVFVGDIQRRMQGLPPPNAPSTIAKKGSSTTLVDKGQLKSSILSKVTEE